MAIYNDPSYSDCEIEYDYEVVANTQIPGVIPQDEADQARQDGLLSDWEHDLHSQYNTLNDMEA